MTGRAVFDVDLRDLGYLVIVAKPFTSKSGRLAGIAFAFRCSQLLSEYLSREEDISETPSPTGFAIAEIPQRRTRQASQDSGLGLLVGEMGEPVVGMRSKSEDRKSVFKCFQCIRVDTLLQPRNHCGGGPPKPGFGLSGDVQTLAGAGRMQGSFASLRMTSLTFSAFCSALCGFASFCRASNRLGRARAHALHTLIVKQTKGQLLIIC